MKPFHQPIRLLSAACLFAIAGCGHESAEPAIPVEEVVKQIGSANLETEAAVRHVVSHAAASPRAVIFVHVDWALMEPHRTRFAQFAMEYQNAHPTDDLGFHYVDCTPVTSGYAPLAELPGWKELQDAAGTSLIHGHGELVWMERGRVLHVERILDFNSTAELIEKTEGLMPPKRSR